MVEAKVVNTPVVKIENTQEETGEIQGETEDNNYPYREAIGSLLYLTKNTRPDIAFSVNFGSRYMGWATRINVIGVKRIFRYLRGSIDDSTQYHSEGCTDELIAYSDSDYAGDPETRKSTTGYTIFYRGGPISWCSKKQRIIALSSTEAEYIAAYLSVVKI